jgi:hypothetical protein
MLPHAPGDIPAKPSAPCTRPAPNPPTNGSAATVSNAKNQTAKRVPELSFRNTRNNTHAKAATNIPSGSALRIRSIEIRAADSDAARKDEDEENVPKKDV